MKRTSIGIALLLALISAGCSGSGTPNREAQTGALGASEAQQKETPLADLKKSYDETKAAYLAHRSDKTVAAAFGAAASQYAYGLMLGDGAPREKYPQALEVANEALEADPTNDLAKTTKMNIEAVYKEMGRTPPKLGGK